MSDCVATNIPWLPSISQDWKLGKVKQLFYISKELSYKPNPVILSLARSGVKVRDISNNEGQLATNYDNYNSVQPGDLLLNPMDLYSGANCNVSYVNGVISPAYSNLRAKEQLEPRFFDFYFKVQYWTMAMFAHGKGVSFDNRWTLNADSLLNYEIPVPSYAEQKKAVTFLNEKISEIDELITNQEKQIEKLEEYKQSLITKAVTKGLNPNVKMKDSGVQSIGLYPANWSLLRTKFAVRSISKGNGITKDEVSPAGDIDCVRYGEIYSKFNISFTKAISKTNLHQIKDPQYISYGDILCSGTGELVEEIGKNVVYLGKDNCLAGGDIIVLKHSQNPRFLNYALYCSASQTQKSYGKAKLKVVHISASDIGNVILTLPGSDEQMRIANYLEEKCKNINRLIETKNYKIACLKEFKKSLIYECVTGKRRISA